MWFSIYMIAQMLSHVKKERKAQIEKITREAFLSLKPYRFRLGKAYLFAKIFVPYLTTAYGQPEKSLISCGFARLDLFTSTCFCLSWCVTASVFSGVNGFWLRSILNPPQRKLIEQKTEWGGTRTSLRIDCCCNLYTGLLLCYEVGKVNSERRAWQFKEKNCWDCV